MNYRLLAKIFGAVLLLVALAMFLCLGVAWFESNKNTAHPAFQALGISGAVTLLASILLLAIGWKSGSELLRKEAMVVVGLSWIIAATFGSLPYILCGTELHWSKALFESMSGYTATGSTVIADLDIYPRSILLYRALTQWLGGLGILVLFVAVLSYLGVGSKALMRHESSFNTGEGSARIQKIASNLWLIYISFSLICCLGLRFVGQLSGGQNLSWYDAITHALTTVSTGGFSPYNKSIGHFDNLAVEIWLIFFMLLCSINFMLYASFFARRWLNRWRNEEEGKCLLILYALALTVTALVLIFHQNQEPTTALRHTAFHVASILTTTGYATTDYGLWPLAAHILILFLMIVGGSSGSTSGGVKVSRILLFLRISKQEIKRSFRPGVVYPLHLNNNKLEERTRGETTFYLGLVAALALAATISICLIEPAMQDLKTALSSVIATLCNIGPGLGAVGPASNFDGYLPSTYIFFSLLMLLGRLELFAILVLFIPSLWRKF